MPIKARLRQLFSTIFSAQGATAGTMIAAAIILGVGINTLLSGKITPTESILIDSLEVYADDALCGQVCQTGVLGESCGGSQSPGTCQDDGSGTCTPNNAICSGITDPVSCENYAGGGICSFDSGSCLISPSQCTGPGNCSSPRCSGTSGALICSCPNEDGETLCNDNIDNDGDGDEDCDDSSCTDETICIPNGDPCDFSEAGDACAEGAGICEMSETNGQCIPDDPFVTGCGGIGNQNDCENGPCIWEGDVECVTAPPPAEICNDGIDNDGDTLADCADSECTTDPYCTYYNLSCGSYCGDNTQGSVCGGTSNGTCEGNNLSCSPNNQVCQQYNGDATACNAVAGGTACTHTGTACIVDTTQQCTGTGNCNSPRCDSSGTGVTCDCGSQQVCGTANGTQYYTLSSTRPDDAGQGTLCANGGTPTSTPTLANGVWSRSCQDEPSCSATNNFCGDSIIDTASGEACDSLNLGSNSCGTEGFDSGDLLCSAQCGAVDTIFCRHDFYCNYDNDSLLSDTVNCQSGIMDENAANVACRDDAACQSPSGTCACSDTMPNPGDCDDTDASRISGCSDLFCDFDGDGENPSNPNCNEDEATCETVCPASNPDCCSASAGNDCLDLMVTNEGGALTVIPNSQAANVNTSGVEGPGNTCNDNLDNDCNGLTDTNDTAVCTAVTFPFYCDFDGDGQHSNEVNCTDTESNGQECSTGALCPSGQCQCYTDAGTDCDDTNPGIQTGCNGYTCDFDGDDYMPGTPNCLADKATCDAACNTAGCCDLDPDDPIDCLDGSYDIAAGNEIIPPGAIESVPEEASTGESSSVGETCEDTYDNDCDGIFDCNESSCGNYSVCQQQQSGFIGGTVVIDTNGNSLQNPGDTVYDGAVVTLYRADGTIEATTTTMGGTGAGFGFSNVPLGGYYLHFELPLGYQFTTPNVGDTGNPESDLDSDVDNSFGPGTTNLFSLTTGGQSIYNYDAIISQAQCDDPSSVNVSVNASLASCGNNDGTITATFSGPTGATPSKYILLDSQGNEITQVSSTQNSHLFTGLIGNTTYSVEVEYTSSQGAIGCDTVSTQTTIPKETGCPTTCDPTALLEVISITDEGVCGSFGGEIIVNFSATQNVTNVRHYSTNSSLASGNTFSGLTSGTYNLYTEYDIVGGDSGCSTLDTGTTVTATVACSGSGVCDNTAGVSVTAVENVQTQNDGSISAVFNGATDNQNIEFRLVLPGGSTLGNSTGVFNNLAAGQYSLYAVYNTASGASCDTRQNTPAATITIVGSNPTECTGTAEVISVLNEDVCGNNNGEIQVLFTGPNGATNIEYNIYGTSTYTDPNGDGIFPGLSPMTYSIHVDYTTAGGTQCNTSEITATIGTDSCPDCDATAFVEIIGVFNESGTNANDGSTQLFFNGSNSNSNVVYYLDNGSTTNTSSSPGFTFLSPGTYSTYATYTAASGVMCTTQTHPANPATLTIGAFQGTQCDATAQVSIQSTNETSCNADDGTISTSLFGTTGSVQNYYIKQGNNIIQQNSFGYFAGLQAGAYTVGAYYTSSSGNSCSVIEQSVTIVAASCASCDETSTSASITANNESSCDANDGSIYTSFNGPGTAIAYNLMQGTSIIASNTTGNFAGVIPGTYRVEVLYSSSTATSCEVTTSNITVQAAQCDSCEQDAEIILSFENETTCNGANGSITAQLTAVSPSAGISYSLIQGTTVIRTNTSGNFSGLEPGTYYVSASYQGNNQTCNEISNTVTIGAAQCGNQCDDAKFVLSGTDETTCNADDGSISLLVDNAQNVERYNLRQNGVTVTTSNNGSFSNVAPGTYTIQVVYNDCTFQTTSITINAAPCSGGGCDANATVTGTITNETTCDANNGRIQAAFNGSGTPSFYRIARGTDGESIAQNQSGLFTGLEPGNYTVYITYQSTDNTTCSEISSVFTIEEAACTDATCGIASNNAYSFANDIVQSQQCVGGVAGNVGRNLDYWEWQCVGITTVTCQADIRDRDGDGILDPDDQCIDVPGIEEEQGCPRSGSGRKRSGKGGSITPGVCGNGSREWNEACDDGNLSNFDGCDQYCEVEKRVKDPEAPKANPTEMIVKKIRSSIQSIQAACSYDDIDYDSRLRRFKDISWEDRYDPSYILTLYCITKGYKDNFQRTKPTGIGEAIKMVTKVHAIGSNMTFNERAITPGRMPYDDISSRARYAPYVVYGQNRGIMQGFTSSHINPRKLKALTPIKPDQFDLLISNAGGSMIPLAQPGTDADDLFDFLDFITPAPSHGSANGKYITRQQASEMVVSAFPDRFRNYKYLVGNNLEFYETLIRKIQNKSGEEQTKFVEKTILELESADRDLMGRQLEIDARVIIEFLKEIINEL